MVFNKTKLNDVYIIEPEKLVDSRGFFARTFCEKEFADQGINFSVVQANISYSAQKHTLRGMHYQVKPHQEAKLIKCTKGAIFDVIMDIRPDSSTFKQWLGVELSEQNRKMLYIPEGFAHGFMTLEDDAEIYYPVSGIYMPGAEKGIRWNDPAFNIGWPASPKVISEKDRSWPLFKNSVDKEVVHNT